MSGEIQNGPGMYMESFFAGFGLPYTLPAGNEKEISPDILKKIPNPDKIRTVEPEDTLIIIDQI